MPIPLSEAARCQSIPQALPTVRRERCARLSPIDVLLAAPRRQPLVMLHSGRLHARWSRWSLAARPTGVLRHHHGRTYWDSLDGGGTPCSRFSDDPIADLSAIESGLEATSAPSDSFGEARAWRAGWIGYVSYDFGRIIEPRAAMASRERRDAGSSWPLYEWFWCPQIYVHDAIDSQWYRADACGAAPINDQALRDALHLTDKPENHAHGEPALDQWRAPQSCESVRDSVQAAIEYIRAGDIFQANLARQFMSRLRVEPRQLAAAAWRASPGWYGAYLECSSDRTLLSLSPELFLEIDRGSRSIVTRPLKGTIPASASPSQSHPRAALERSTKDAAELNMIIDLMRNDLGRVCEYGSVKVTQPRAIESHPTVHHGVATIEGRLREGAGFVEVLRAAFPAGSITGAPKIRAMQIIDELEPFARGPYCGTIGYVGPDRICLNVAIRTMMIDSDKVTYNAGAGIVADSTPRHEVEEMDAKAAVVQALASSRSSASGQAKAIGEAEVDV